MFTLSTLNCGSEEVYVRYGVHWEKAGLLHAEAKFGPSLAVLALWLLPLDLGSLMFEITG